MRRTFEQWRLMAPKAVVDGSAAQAMFCIADAKADIAELQEIVVAARALHRRRVEGPSEDANLFGEWDDLADALASVKP